MGNQIKIVQYKDSLAKKIKEMWDNSVTGWNGYHWNETEESVKAKSNNSSHLDLSLAEVDDLVAGYCKLSKDHDDSDALYVDLLNVRDDYHGKKLVKPLLKML